MNENVETLLVLPGGGAKGIFQWSVWRRIQAHVKVDAVVGTSVGALNGWLVATGNESLGDRVWQKMDEKAVFKKRSLLAVALKTGLARLLHQRAHLGLYDTMPLKTLIRSVVEGSAWKYKMPFNCSRVNMINGAIKYDTSAGNDVWRDMYASSAMPGVFDPIEYDGGLWVDGGLRDITPLGYGVKRYGETLKRIIIIPNQPTDQVIRVNQIRDLVDVVQHGILGIMLDEIFQNDMAVFLERNTDPAYKRFQVDILAPPSSLGKATDFSQSMMINRAAVAVNVARKWLAHNVE